MRDASSSRSRPDTDDVGTPRSAAQPATALLHPPAGFWDQVGDAIRTHCDAQTAGVVFPATGSASQPGGRSDGQLATDMMARFAADPDDLPCDLAWRDPGDDSCCAAVAAAVEGEPIVLWVRRRLPFAAAERRRLRSLADLVAQVRLLERQRAHAELMLQDATHRSRNDLQLVGSFISYQANQATDPCSAAVLASAAARIATLHLARRTPTGDVVATLGQLLAALRAQIDESAVLLHLVVEGEPPDLPERQKTLVLIGVNELVTNALKHAFRTRRQGQVTVLVRHAEGRLRVVVDDDGLPLAAADRRPSPGSGLALVRRLMEGARGTLRLPDDTSKRFTIEMPLRDAAGVASANRRQAG